MVKMTERALAATIKRTYRCRDCHHEFKWIHSSMDEPHPDCPMCPPSQNVVEPPEWIPPLVGRRTAISQAVDHTWEMAQNDYGLTNINDHQRPGDIAFKPDAPMQTAEKETIQRELIEAFGAMPAQVPADKAGAVDNFWQGQMGSATTEQTVAAQKNTAPAMAAARAEGSEPLSILEAAKNQGIKPGYRVVGRAGMDDTA